MTELDLLIRGSTDVGGALVQTRRVLTADEADEQREAEALAAAIAAADRQGEKVVRLCGYQATRVLAVSFSGLTLCRTLEVSRNLRLRSIDPSVALLDHLESLSLAHCDFQDFPKALLSMQNLTCLDLTNNAIPHVPQGVVGMKGLRTLLLDSNQLRSLPIALTRTDVVHLRIGNNPLLPRDTPEDTPLHLPKDRLAACDVCGGYVHLETQAHTPPCTKLRFLTYCGIREVPLHYELHNTEACCAFVK